MLWIFAAIGLLLVVVIGLVVLGRETARLASEARPAVFDLTQAVDFIADRLPAETQARISHDDVRWVLLADADLLEEATAEVPADEEETEVVDEEVAIARILALADDGGRDLADADVVAVLAGRSAYLEAIGAIGPEA
jgi:molybdopterin converting factor small subunit